MIHFDARSESHKMPFGALACGQNARFEIEALRDGNDAVEAYLVMALDGCEPVYISFSRRSGNTFDFDWQAPFKGLFYYRFKVVYEDGFAEESRLQALTVYECDSFAYPDWLQQGLMYQIFPDRFCRGSDFDAKRAENLLTRGRFLNREWGELPEPGNVDFFGGTLAGIAEQLDYLAELGVTVIYLNPIFAAFSNHRYDTADYTRIDPLLGTYEDFRNLCLAASERGMRIIVDGVFNHTGSDSIYFNKEKTYGEGGAYNDPDSTYFSWYTFSKYPHVYDCWWGIHTLPAVNEENESYQYFIYGDTHSVVRTVLEAGASGIRLDVADELPDVFIDGLRSAMKETKSNSALIGEVWEDASNKISYGQRRRYLQGGQLDSVMNYPVKDAIIAFLNGEIDAARFMDTVESLRENYPADVFYGLMNILGTHDTARIRTVLGSDAKLFQAVMLQMFLPGIPCIYYGDEHGMTGERDPFNRGCFEPEKADEKVKSFYNRLLAFRKQIAGIGHPSKLGGYTSFRSFGAKDGVYLFTRENEEMSLVVAVNCGSYAVVEPEWHIDRMLAEGRATVDDRGNLHLPSGSCAVMYCSKK